MWWKHPNSPVDFTEWKTSWRPNICKNRPLSRLTPLPFSSTVPTSSLQDKHFTLYNRPIKSIRVHIYFISLYSFFFAFVFFSYTIFLFHSISMWWVWWHSYRSMSNSLLLLCFLYKGMTWLTMSKGLLNTQHEAISTALYITYWSVRIFQCGINVMRTWFLRHIQ